MSEFSEFFDYFQKFRNNPDFEKHEKTLKSFAVIREREPIVIGDVTVPDMGPDKKIFSYESSLEGWSQGDIDEFKHSRDLFFRGGIQSIDFCKFTSNILSAMPEFSEEDILFKVRDCLDEGEIPNEDQISHLIMSDDEQLRTLGTSIMMSMLDH